MTNTLILVNAIKITCEVGVTMTIMGVATLVTLITMNHSNQKPHQK